MAEKILAVFDRDINYTERFIGYMTDRKKLPFRTIGFSRPEALADYADRHYIDVLLVGDTPASEALGRQEKALCESFFTRKDIGKVLFLDEKQAPDLNPGHINKYRSMEKITADILMFFKCDGTGLSGMTELSDITVYGIYSPECEAVSQGFALAFAERQAVANRVLYMNLERFSGIKKIMNIDKPETLSDIIYYYENKKDRLAEIISDAVIKTGNFDCITAHEETEDLSLIPASGWEDFLTAIAGAGNYEVIVIEPGSAFEKPEKILELCRKIYVPYTKGELVEKQLEQMEKWLFCKCGKEMTEKTVKLKLDLGNLIKEHGEAADSGYPEACFRGEYARAADTVCEY